MVGGWEDRKQNRKVLLDNTKFKNNKNIEEVLLDDTNKNTR